jgi:hypothetical protein
MIIPAVRTVAGKKAPFDRPTKNGVHNGQDDSQAGGRRRTTANSGGLVMPVIEVERYRRPWRRHN